MIFAAGLGTRLAPLTDRMPKALVTVHGRPLLHHVMDRLVAAGATRLVINTSRFGEQIAAYVDAHTPLGVDIVLSHEPDGPYDTGGGLAQAAPLFLARGPIVLHNVDVLSRIPLEELVAAHQGALVTVAVQDRDTRRKMLFDDLGLMGWRSGEQEQRAREPQGTVRALAFAGIHVIAPELLRLTERAGTFPIRDLYLDLAARGYVIRPVDVSEHEWLDVGTPERLAEAEARSW